MAEKKETTKKEAAPAKEKKVVAKGTDVAFTPEQVEVINKMMADTVRNSSRKDGGVSVYGQRDPRSIETVNVKRVLGKFVIGFKDHQIDPFKKGIEPLYVTYKKDPVRKLANEPFITLILSDGTEEEEVEMMLVDYYAQREKFEAKVVDIKKEEIIESDGLLGSTSVARNIDEGGNVTERPSIKAEKKRLVQTFKVELPGFAEPVTFVDDPKGPLA